MQLTVEFFGIPRQHTGVARVILSFSQSITLGEVLQELSTRFPDFAAECLSEGHLRKQFTANIDGDRFVSEPTVSLQDGDALLIMSTDAGG